MDMIVGIEEAFFGRGNVVLFGILVTANNAATEDGMDSALC